MQNKTIIVTEDNAMQNFIVSGAFEDAGYKVHSFETAEQAIDALKKGDIKPDLFFTDNDMVPAGGKMTGLEFQRYIKENYDKPSILNSTMSITLEQVKDHGGEHAHILVCKPCSPEMMVGAAKDAIEHHQNNTVPLDNLKVLLVVEDNPADRELNIRALKRGGYREESGYRFVELKTVEAALEFQKKLELMGKKPDGIVTDYDTPANGRSVEAIELIKYMKGKSVPTVMVTGNQGITEEHLREAGGNHIQYLIKSAIDNSKEIPALLKRSRDVITAAILNKLDINQSQNGLDLH